MPRQSTSKQAPSYGDGSVYQRGDGYWVATVTLAGRRIVKYAKTEREAKQKLADLQREHFDGTLAAPVKLTVSEWIEQWLEQSQPNLRPSTHYTYSSTLPPLTALIGHVRLYRLTPAAIASALSKLQRQGKGAR
ncbi:MAG: hypothetical protein NTZ05_08030, partial [Chloroflexi bacterium]|nr:hypothetical protein [Chloroflexota bacterium]